MAPIALVTGASRGVGKACAIELARAGFDVALAARTQREGEEREHSLTLTASDVSPLPGSLEATARAVEGEGRRALAVPMDLLDRASLGAGVVRVLQRWGRIDVLVNSARYVGPGHLDRFLDTPIDLIERQLEANAVAPLVLIKLIAPAMLDQGGGVIVNVTSGAAVADPQQPVGGPGGWGVGYGMSKAALHRVVGVLRAEWADTGIRTYNVEPGSVATERMSLDLARRGFDPSRAAPPRVVGAVVAWLATSGDAHRLDGSHIDAQALCAQLGLVPDWPPRG